MRILVSLLLLFSAMPSWAERLFDVEVIIFKRTVDAESQAESWPNQVSEIDMARARSFHNSSYLETKGVKMLPYSSYQLKNQKAALSQHAGFEVIKHVAWRQGDQGKGSAPVFHIVGGRDYSAEFNPDGSDKATYPQGFNGELAESNNNKALHELNGKLQIYVQHYLFAEATLDIKQPSVRAVHMEDSVFTGLEQIEELEQGGLEQAQIEQAADQVENNVQLGNLVDVSPTIHQEAFLKSYRFDQKRRMRSSETHYLDHPLMGMIIQVRRVP